MNLDPGVLLKDVEDPDVTLEGNLEGEEGLVMPFELANPEVPTELTPNDADPPELSPDDEYLRLLEFVEVNLEPDVLPKDADTPDVGECGAPLLTELVELNLDPDELPEDPVEPEESLELPLELVNPEENPPVLDSSDPDPLEFNPNDDGP